MLNSSYATCTRPDLTTTITVFNPFAVRKLCKALTLAVRKVEGLRDVVVALISVPHIFAPTSDVSGPSKQFPLLAAMFDICSEVCISDIGTVICQPNGSIVQDA